MISILWISLKSLRWLSSRDLTGENLVYLNLSMKLEKKSGRKTNSDLWFYSLALLNGLVMLFNLVAVFIRTKSSDLRVPIRLVAGNEYVQGNWWNSYLILLIMFGFGTAMFIYSFRLKRLDSLYRNGVLLIGVCVQIIAFGVLFRVAGLSSLI